MFPVAPQVFDGIEFRGVRRQVLGGDPSVQAIEKFANQPASVRGQPIPDDQQRRSDSIHEVGEEQNNLFFGHSFLEKLEIEVPQGHARGYGNGLPIEVILQNRSLSPRRPGAAAVWPLAQPAFVDENDRTAFFFGFFLMAGHVFRFHSPMASSLRSSARPIGRCGLHFNCRRSLQTWPE
jgi:hypothetical protein